MKYGICQLAVNAALRRTIFRVRKDSELISFRLLKSCSTNARLRQYTAWRNTVPTHISLKIIQKYGQAPDEHVNMQKYIILRKSI